MESSVTLVEGLALWANTEAIGSAEGLCIFKDDAESWGYLIEMFVNEYHIIVILTFTKICLIYS